MADRTAVTPEYPPLTPLDGFPLHSGTINGRTVPFACRVSMALAFVFFDWRCDDCLQRAIGYADAGHDRDILGWVPKGNDPVQEHTLQWYIDRAIYWKNRAS